MDPNECMEMLRQAQRDNNSEEELECYRNLDEWMRKGGFPPVEWIRERSAR